MPYLPGGQIPTAFLKIVHVIHESFINSAGIHAIKSDQFTMTFSTIFAAAVVNFHGEKLKLCYPLMLCRSASLLALFVEQCIYSIHDFLILHSEKI